MLNLNHRLFYLVMCLDVCFVRESTPKPINHWISAPSEEELKLKELSVRGDAGGRRCGT